MKFLSKLKNAFMSLFSYSIEDKKEETIEYNRSKSVTVSAIEVNSITLYYDLKEYTLTMDNDRSLLEIENTAILDTYGTGSISADAGKEGFIYSGYVAEHLDSGFKTFQVNYTNKELRLIIDHYIHAIVKNKEKYIKDLIDNFSNKVWCHEIYDAINGNKHNFTSFPTVKTKEFIVEGIKNKLDQILYEIVHGHYVKVYTYSVDDTNGKRELFNVEFIQERGMKNFVISFSIKTKESK